MCTGGEGETSVLVILIESECVFMCVFVCEGHKRRRHIVRRVHCVINLSAIKTHFLSATRRPENKSGLQILNGGESETICTPAVVCQISARKIAVPRRPRAPQLRHGGGIRSISVLRIPYLYRAHPPIHPLHPLTDTCLSTT